MLAESFCCWLIVQKKKKDSIFCVYLWKLKLQIYSLFAPFKWVNLNFRYGVMKSVKIGSFFPDVLNKKRKDAGRRTKLSAITRFKKESDYEGLFIVFIEYWIREKTLPDMLRLEIYWNSFSFFRMDKTLFQVKMKSWRWIYERKFRFVNLENWEMLNCVQKGKNIVKKKVDFVYSLFCCFI